MDEIPIIPDFIAHLGCHMSRTPHDFQILIISVYNWSDNISNVEPSFKKNANCKPTLSNFLLKLCQKYLVSNAEQTVSKL